MADDPVLLIPIKDYIDRSIDNAVRQQGALWAKDLEAIKQQFVTRDDARDLAGTERRQNQLWLSPSLPTIVSLGISIILAVVLILRG